MPDTHDRIQFSGLTPDGQYAWLESPPEALGRHLLQTLDKRSGSDGTATDAAEAEALHARELENRRQGREPHLGPRYGVDPTDLAQTGWGVVFPAVKPGTEEARDLDAIQEALAPLLRLRQAQAGDRFRVLSGAQGYRPGQTKVDFLRRLGAVPSGAVDPRVLPYYLLLVGSPEAIPFEVQYQLDVQFAVGRVHFDLPESYAHYAESIVTAETRGLALSPRGAFFGPEHPGDAATHLTRSLLLPPLADCLRGAGASGRPESSRLVADTFFGPVATRRSLEALLGGSETPALLVCAGHGLSPAPSDPAADLLRRGALICQDWTPGAPLTDEVLFSADHLSMEAKVHGLIAFFMACFSGGSPRWSSFPGEDHGTMQPREVSPRPFLAELPRRLLAHPRGGALAVVGHVDLATNRSYVDPTIRSPRAGYTQFFEDFLNRLCEGQPIGHCLDDFGQRYADLASDLAEHLTRLRRHAGPVDGDQLTTLTYLWAGAIDARNFTLIGDPAVRLMGRAGARGQESATPGSEASLPSVPASGAGREGIGHPEPDPGAVPSETPPGQPGLASTVTLSRGVPSTPAPGRAAPEAMEVPEAAPGFEVRTYLCTDPELPDLPPDVPLRSAGRLVALTRIHRNGYIEQIIHRPDGRPDPALEDLHREAVRRSSWPGPDPQGRT